MVALLVVRPWMPRSSLVFAISSLSSCYNIRGLAHALFQLNRSTGSNEILPYYVFHFDLRTGTLLVSIHFDLLIFDFRVCPSSVQIGRWRATAERTADPTTSGIIALLSQFGSASLVASSAFALTIDNRLPSWEKGHKI